MNRAFVEFSKLFLSLLVFFTPVITFQKFQPFLQNPGTKLDEWYSSIVRLIVTARRRK